VESAATSHRRSSVSLGVFVSPSEPNCSPVREGVGGSVRCATDRFAVDVKGNSPSVVSEIQVRAQWLERLA
jgi:hypothetical protein